MTQKTSQNKFRSRFGLNLNVDDDAFTALEQRLTIINDSVNTGEQFTESLRVLVGKHSLDIVFIDPLLSFVGGDIPNQRLVRFSWQFAQLNIEGEWCFSFGHTHHHHGCDCD